MNNSIQAEASSIHLLDEQDYVCIVNSSNRYNIELETVLNIMENLLLINDYNLEEEQVAVDRYYVDSNSFRHEEVEKTEWFDMYDFINDLTLDQASQILTSFLKENEDHLDLPF